MHIASLSRLRQAFLSRLGDAASATDAELRLRILLAYWTIVFVLSLGWGSGQLASEVGQGSSFALVIPFAAHQGACATLEGDSTHE